MGIDVDDGEPACAFATHFQGGTYAKVGAPRNLMATTGHDGPVPIGEQAGDQLSQLLLSRLELVVDARHIPRIVERVGKMGGEPA